MNAPLLVQYPDLTAQHFSRHPVWISVHAADGNEPWYGDTDEETFRPWLGALPVGWDDGWFLVRATFTLADGTTLPGFATPLQERRLFAPEDLLQAEVFLPSGRREQFWNGTIPRAAAERAALLAELGKAGDAVFPVRVDADRGLAREHAAGMFTEF